MISQRNSRKIKVLSFILFVGVMIIHAYNLELYDIQSGFVAIFEKYTNRLMNGLCVPYFFVISGFLFFRNFDIAHLFDKYKSRFRSILIPYLAWNTLYYLFFAFASRVPFLDGIINSEAVEVSFGAYVHYIWNGYYVFWFIRVLIWMILCAPLLWILLKRRKWYWPEIILVILIILDMYGKSVFAINVYYVLGAYLGINHSNMLLESNKKLAIAATVGVLMLLSTASFFAGNIIYNIIFMLTSWLALDLFAFSKELAWWIECTFFYYCAHDLVLESIKKVFLILTGGDIEKQTVNVFLSYLVTPVLTLIVLGCVAWIIQRYFKVIWGILNGGR